MNSSIQPYLVLFYKYTHTMFWIEKLKARVETLTAQIWILTEVVGKVNKSIKDLQPKKIYQPMANPNYFKRCTHCKRILPLTKYHKDPCNWDWLHSWCSDCKNKQMRDIKTQYWTHNP